MFGFRPRASHDLPAPSGRPAAAVALDHSGATAVTLAGTPRPVSLGEGGSLELPLVVRLDPRPLSAGGLNLVRAAPHRVCTNYLGQLGEARHWQSGKLSVTPDQAARVTLDAIRVKLADAPAVALGLPATLSPAQVKHLPVVGSVAVPLALAAARALRLLSPPDDASPELGEEFAPAGTRPLPAGRAVVLVVECDEFALSVSRVAVNPGSVSLAAHAAWPRLSRKVLTDRLIDGLSDRCVRLCRRDPRDTASAEQMLFDQLDAALDFARTWQGTTVPVRSEHWFQDIPVRPGDLAQMAKPLTELAAGALRKFVADSPDTLPPAAVWLTHGAARWPGLAEALHKAVPEQTAVCALSALAPAEAVAALLPRMLAGEIGRPHAEREIATAGGAAPAWKRPHPPGPPLPKGEGGEAFWAR